MKNCQPLQRDYTGPSGTWIAVWPGGQSSGWKSREQAIHHANSYRPVRKLGLRLTR